MITSQRDMDSTLNTKPTRKGRMSKIKIESGGGVGAQSRGGRHKSRSLLLDRPTDVSEVGQKWERTPSSSCLDYCKAMDEESYPSQCVVCQDVACRNCTKVPKEMMYFMMISGLEYICCHCKRSELLTLATTSKTLNEMKDSTTSGETRSQNDQFWNFGGVQEAKRGKTPDQCKASVRENCQGSQW